MNYRKKVFNFYIFVHFRSIIAECMASFLYVFIVCGAAAGAGVGASVSSVLLATALASGFVVTTLTQCFSHISGKNAMWCTKKRRSKGKCGIFLTRQGKYANITIAQSPIYLEFRHFYGKIGNFPALHEHNEQTEKRISLECT